MPPKGRQGKNKYKNTKPTTHTIREQGIDVEGVVAAARAGVDALVEEARQTAEWDPNEFERGQVLGRAMANTLFAPGNTTNKVTYDKNRVMAEDLNLLSESPVKDGLMLIKTALVFLDDFTRNGASGQKIKETKRNIQLILTKLKDEPGVLTVTKTRELTDFKIEIDPAFVTLRNDALPPEPEQHGL